jgi:hypothetical protein
MINMPTSPIPNSFNAAEQHWKHFLTNIPPSVTKRLTFIGVIYILIGILSIALELELFFGLNAT